MISETAFLDCENLPAEMAGRFDQPWHFVGEVKTDTPCLRVHCHLCRNNKVTWGVIPARLDPLVAVDMLGHRFITDDMIEVIVYFGVCKECDAVYWARQGPPFKRARRRVTA